MTGLAAPLGALTQMEGDRLSVSCNTKPGVFGDQETVAWPGAAETIIRVGVPVVGTAMGSAQNPPISENYPPLIGPPASGCPIVPVTAKTLPVLPAPAGPPSTVNQSMEKDWASIRRAVIARAITTLRTASRASRSNKLLDFITSVVGSIRFSLIG